MADRTEAISHRIRTAGIRRKITPDQVRAIRIVLSGTHEDMAKVQDEGRLSEWCDDNLQWLHRTFGRENTVSAVLHIAVRQAVFIHSENGCTAQKGQRLGGINNNNGRVASLRLGLPQTSCYPPVG